MTGNNGQGVYVIRSLVNNKSYVGSSNDILRRQREHWKMLRGSCHDNIHLQRAWNKYGEDAFEFILIEYVNNETDLNVTEQGYIDKWNPEYNICRVAGSTRGRKWTDEQRQAKRMWWTDERKLAIREWWTDERKQRVSKRMFKRKWTEEQKQNASKRNAGKNSYWYGATGEKNPNYGNRWKQSSEQIRHKSGKNSHLYGVIGEDNHNARFSQGDADEIREKYASGKYIYTELAKEYDVHWQTIGRIVRKERYTK